MASAKSSSIRTRLRSGKPPETFGLTGPSVVLDKRVNAVRGDVADLALAGILFAPHYAQPMPMTCVAPSTAVRDGASDDAALTSELILGETFQVLDTGGDWSWGYCDADHYVGYVRADALGALRSGEWRISVPLATTSLSTDLFMGARVSGIRDGDRIETPLGTIGLSDVDAPSSDPVTIAEAFLGAPYLLGGRTVRGIDCSGLVQIAHAMIGRQLPRDSDLQRDAAGMPLAPGSALQRGDIVFFPGHVGLMADASMLLHATGHHQAVVIEPLATVEARTAPGKAYRP